ncbi:DUF4383 domain-containing protein [Mycolicibacterium litorale]|uniref:Membrane protein n=1 Tax=Mycolicibacterium litorale TaxID=758802 RepID=A0AAD1MXI0_9MYCO|nr:DUF4383 domain-containing protein [Mycolicibacterium litorale]MCV7418437.1 DUF4383 domain-containing protein [Mycolicibacterium litorale]TDY06165.1 uncharacterized protein DUF4383 [Mycolicibacterium litorale]BBY19692.1 membrane protein [Mycolicibacterium litorale]
MATPGTQGTPKAAPTAGKAPVQKAALAVGAVFLLVGILGFIPGITTDYDKLAFAGHHSGAMLFGIFAVSVLHNVVHLLFGVAGVALHGTFNGAKWYLIGGGLVYAALWVYGLVVGRHSPANFVPFNSADNWLHLGLAAGMLALGILLGRVPSTAPHDRRHA